jgi:hypothetical protein
MGDSYVHTINTVTGEVKVMGFSRFRKAVQKGAPLRELTYQDGDEGAKVKNPDCGAEDCKQDYDGLNG